MAEIWLDIEKYPNYRVSSLGRVMNKTRGTILKPRPDKHGYLRVYLYDGSGNGHEESIHRLVASAFYDGDYSDLQVNHIDGDKSNNFIANLEFVTASDNLKHSYRTGLRDSPRNRTKSVRIRETGKIFDSVRGCARYLGCRHSNVSLCINGLAKTCCGYHVDKYDDN